METKKLNRRPAPWQARPTNRINSMNTVAAAAAVEAGRAAGEHIGNALRVLELERKVAALEAENKTLKSAVPSAFHKEIKEFGRHDYNRLIGMASDDVKRIGPLSDPYMLQVKKTLNDMCKHKRIHIMDKESGIAFEASGAVGFDGDKLLIFSER